MQSAELRGYAVIIKWKGQESLPIKIPNGLPAVDILAEENIFVMTDTRAITQDIRPLKIGVLNLMPVKHDTEIQLLRAMSNTPLQVDVTFVCVENHISKNTPMSHLNKFYSKFPEIKNQKFDGFIITGYLITFKSISFL